VIAVGTPRDRRDRDEFTPGATCARCCLARSPRLATPVMLSAASWRADHPISRVRSLGWGEYAGMSLGELRIQQTSPRPSCLFHSIHLAFSVAVSGNPAKPIVRQGCRPPLPRDSRRRRREGRRPGFLRGRLPCASSAFFLVTGAGGSDRSAWSVKRRAAGRCTKRPVVCTD